MYALCSALLIYGWCVMAMSNKNFMQHLVNVCVCISPPPKKKKKLFGCPSSQIFFNFWVCRSDSFFLLLYSWGAEFGTSTNDFYASFIIIRVEQSVICCIWRSYRDLKPNYSHKTNFFLLFWTFIYFIFLIKKREKKLTHFSHILESVAEGNTTFFSSSQLPHWGQEGSVEQQLFLKVICRSEFIYLPIDRLIDWSIRKTFAILRDNCFFSLIFYSREIYKNQVSRGSFL